MDAATSFYLTVFAPLGFQEVMRHPHEGSFAVGIAGPSGFPHFWLSPLTGDAGWEAHIAFTAPSRDAVDAVYQAALSAGAQILHQPRVWPEYHDNYYGVFLRDLDGNNVEAVSHR